MHILFLTTAHNSLSQRAHIELTRRGHRVSVAVVDGPEAMVEATRTHDPDIVLAPMLKRAIPSEIWRRYTCLVVHPGIRGDRGPSSLDWAIHRSEARWGVTVLQATGELDAGDIWASREFEMPPRPFSKGFLYRERVTDAAVASIVRALESHSQPGFRPEPLDYSQPDVRGEARPMMRQLERAVDWSTQTVGDITRRIHAADSSPGVADRIFDMDVLMFGAHEEDGLRGEPGAILARRHGAICRGTVDGAVWITHLKRRKSDSGPASMKLPATALLGHRVAHIPQHAPQPPTDGQSRSFREIRYVERGLVGYLYFDCYNGAMSTSQCKRLTRAFRAARQRPTRVIVLMGGRDFWSNGIHLNVIEAAACPADESWRNIHAMNDFVRDIIRTDSHWVISAIRGNAGAGGVMMALGADEVLARRGAVLNPHYRSMGGLFGSEYWTYTLPRRVGPECAQMLTNVCDPIGASAACDIGLVDAAFGGDHSSFEDEVFLRAADVAKDPSLHRRLSEKHLRLERDEAAKPLETYREEELAKMWANFYGPDPAYHEARNRFVYKLSADAPLRPHEALFGPGV